MNNKTIKGVLFDLDGTLVDTAPDMVYALNMLLNNYNMPSVDYVQTRALVSDGALALLKHGFGDDLMLHNALRLRHEYLELYADNIHIHSRVFKGFERVQSAFDHHNIPWGIVTNKPAFLSNSLLEKIPGLEQSRCLIAADSMPLRKPHACGLLLGAAEIGVAPWLCAYIGDSRRDIQAAQHARMHSVAATYGYIKDDDDHRSWGADCFIDALPELSDIVKP